MKIKIKGDSFEDIKSNIQKIQLKHSNKYTKTKNIVYDGLKFISKPNTSQISPKISVYELKDNGIIFKVSKGGMYEIQQAIIELLKKKGFKKTTAYLSDLYPLKKNLIFLKR